MSSPCKEPGPCLGSDNRTWMLCKNQTCTQVPYTNNHANGACTYSSDCYSNGIMWKCSKNQCGADKASDPNDCFECSSRTGCKNKEPCLSGDGYWYYCDNGTCKEGTATVKNNNMGGKCTKSSECISEHMFECVSGRCTSKKTNNPDLCRACPSPKHPPAESPPDATPAPSHHNPHPPRKKKTMVYMAVAVLSLLLIYLFLM